MYKVFTDSRGLSSIITIGRVRKGENSRCPLKTEGTVYMSTQDTPGHLRNIIVVCMKWQGRQWGGWLRKEKKIAVNFESKKKKYSDTIFNPGWYDLGSHFEVKTIVG